MLNRLRRAEGWVPAWQGCRFQGSGQGKSGVRASHWRDGRVAAAALLLAQGSGDEAQPRASMSFFVFLRILDPLL